MKRSEAYSKVKELGLQKEIEKAYGRNFTQVSTSLLEEAINKFLAGTKKEEKKEKKKEEKKEEVTAKVTEPVVTAPSSDSMKGSIESKFSKLIEILTKKRILLRSELSYIVEA